MAAPTVTVSSQPIAPAGVGSLTVDVDTWPMMVRARVRATVLTLPAGRWLCQLTINGGPTGQPPMHVEVDQTLASPGTVTIPAQVFRAIRPLDSSAGAINGTVRVLRRVGASWVRYGGCRTLTISVAVAPARLAANKAGVQVVPFTQLTAEVTADATRELTLQLDAAQAAGAEWVRCSFRWGLVQPSAASTWDEAQATKLDSLMTLANARSLKVLAIVGSVSPPAWAADGSGYPTQSKLTTYMAEFFTRWPGVDAVEPSNEPELNGLTALQYTTGHNRTWTAVRAVSAVPVLCGGFAALDLVYLGQVLDVGLTGFDAVSFHPYNLRFDLPSYTGLNPQWGEPTIPQEDGVHRNAVDAVYTVDEYLRGRGLTKPIWITEWGYASAVRAPAPAGHTPKQAADKITTQLRQLARMVEVPVNILHSGMDEDIFNDWRDGFGLLNIAGGPRLAATAYHDTLVGISAGTL